MLPGLEVIMIFCHHPTLAFILAPNQRTLGQLDHRILVWQLDLGVLLLYISLYYYHIIYLYISTQKPNQKQYDVYIYIIYIYRCYKHYTLIFIPKSIYFKTLVYIYLNTIAKYDTAWSVKESNPYVKLYRINTQMDTTQWKSQHFIMG